MVPWKRPEVWTRTPRTRSALVPAWPFFAPEPQTGPLGAGALPGSCAGGLLLTVIGYGGTTVASSWSRVVLLGDARSSGAPTAQLLEVTRESVVEGCGREGTEASTLAKLNAVVMSPVLERRHEDRLGTSTPNRVSSRRSVEV